MVKSIRHDFAHSRSTAPLLLKQEKRGGNQIKEDNLNIGSNWAAQFLLNYGRMNGRPRPDGRDYKKAVKISPDNTIYMLNTFITKREVYDKYKEVFYEACAEKWFLSINLCMNEYIDAIQPHEMPENPVSYDWFTQLWNQKCPFVVVGAKMSDYCDRCKEFTESISTQELFNQQLDHMNAATEHRQFYNDNIKKVYDSTDKMQIDLDYAEGVSYPQFRVQPGSFYFLSPRKVQIFGCVLHNPIGTSSLFNERCLNFLLQEGIHTAGKGCNAVISMVDHVIENFVPTQIKRLYLQGDNCMGQAKNNFFMAYLLFKLISSRRFDSIEFNTMVAGHTKFGPDRAFGSFKRKFKEADVRSFDDLAEVVNNSSKTNEAVPYCKDDTSGLVFFQWKDFLEQFFPPSFVKDMTNSHSFIFARENDTVVLKVKKQCNDEIFSQILLPKDFLKNDIECSKIIDCDYKALDTFKIASGVLSEYRSRYLWKNFHSFMDEEQQKKFVPEYFELNNEDRQEDLRMEYFICKHEHRRLSKDETLKKIKEHGIPSGSFCKYSTVDELHEVLLCFMWEMMTEEEKDAHDPEKHEGGKKAVFQKQLFYKESNDKNKMQKKVIFEKIEKLIQQNGLIDVQKPKTSAKKDVVLEYWLELAWSIEESRIVNTEEGTTLSI